MDTSSIDSEIEHKRGASSTEIIIKKRFSDMLNITDFEQAPIWSGPDGIRTQRVLVESENRKIGIGAISDLESSEVNYVYRSFPTFKFFSKKSQVGEIGWNWQDSTFLNKKLEITGGKASFCFDLSSK